MYAGLRHVETTGGFKSGVKRKKFEITIKNQQQLAEREGFEPSVRLPVQRFSSSKSFMLARAAQWLNVCSSLAFLMR